MLSSIVTWLNKGSIIIIIIIKGSFIVIASRRSDGQKHIKARFFSNAFILWRIIFKVLTY